MAEETLAEFLSKATGTAVDWVQMIGMKVSYNDNDDLFYNFMAVDVFVLTFNFNVFVQPGPESIGIVAVSRNSSGIAARACGLVSLEPTKVLFCC